MFVVSSSEQSDRHRIASIPVGDGEANARPFSHSQFLCQIIVISIGLFLISFTVRSTLHLSMTENRTITTMVTRLTVSGGCLKNVSKNRLKSLSVVASISFRYLIGSQVGLKLFATFMFPRIIFFIPYLEQKPITFKLFRSKLGVIFFKSDQTARGAANPC